MEYRLTQRGREADIKPTPAGKIIGWMQEDHGVCNEYEVGYELQLENPKDVLEKLVKAGYLSKEEESESPFG